MPCNIFPGLKCITGNMWQIFRNNITLYNISMFCEQLALCTHPLRLHCCHKCLVQEAMMLASAQTVLNEKPARPGWNFRSDEHKHTFFEVSLFLLWFHPWRNDSRGWTWRIIITVQVTWWTQWIHKGFYKASISECGSGKLCLFDLVNFCTSQIHIFLEKKCLF